MNRHIIAATLACAFAAPASAATLYDNAAAWEAAVVNSAAVVLPETAPTTNTVFVGPLAFTRGDNASNIIIGGAFDWSTKIAGHDLAISGPEDLVIDIAGGTTGLSFLLHEPTQNIGPAPDSCNATCVDTTFRFELFDGVLLIDSFDINPLDDIANFVGFTSLTAFDKIVVTDLTGTIDNEFFGEFRIAAVPLPAGLPLLLAGLGALTLMRRRS